MLAQLTASAQVEREMGTLPFVILYFAAGIFGFVFSFAPVLRIEIDYFLPVTFLVPTSHWLVPHPLVPVARYSEQLQYVYAFYLKTQPPDGRI